MKTAATTIACLSIALAAAGLEGCRTISLPFHHAHKAPEPAPAAKSQQPTQLPPSRVGPRPREYLDPVTAASIATVASPIVFARAHQDVSANSRQYATVAAVTVNRSGRFDYLLLVYLWSTVDPRLAADVHPGETVVLLADDRAIKLPRDGRTLKEAGLAKPLHAPAHARGSPRLYRTDKATLQFISKTRRLRLQLEGDDDPRPFEVWTDGRPALAQLAAN